MGILPGVEIEIVKFAPLGDPIEIKMNNANLSLRKQEADQILVSKIDTAKTKYMFSQNRPTLVCMSHVSNVTGYILPVNDITEAAKECGATVVIDGAQACGLIPTDLRKLMCDFYIFAGHKTLYGPFGAAGFFKRIGARLEPVMTGGTGTDSPLRHRRPSAAAASADTRGTGRA